MTPDTIAAVATASGAGALAVIRISGSRAFEIVRSLGGLGSTVESHRACLRVLRRGDDVLDQAVVLPFVGPRSFTGEDVVELQCHGGEQTARRVLDAVLAAGARVAEPGEFARRALVNGKLDTVQVEAIADVIHAESEEAHRLAQSHLAGRLSTAVESIRAPLFELVTLVEAAIDFALEEHVYSISPAEICGRVDPLIDDVDTLLATYDAGRLRAAGVRTAIVGPPNAGKSTLLNHLLGEDRAIVTDVPGTTRDTIEESVLVRGVRYHLVDTAGIRDTADRVESLGVERTRRAVGQADIVVVVAAVDEVAAAADVIGTLPSTTWGLVVNKTDLASPSSSAAVEQLVEAASSPPARVLGVSLRDGAEADALEGLLSGVAEAAGLRTGTQAVLLSRARHREALEAARVALGRAREAAAAELGHELVALDLRGAMDALSALTGAVTADDVLDRIFGEFCVGK